MTLLYALTVSNVKLISVTSAHKVPVLNLISAEVKHYKKRPMVQTNAK